jgi:dihydroflavonol-4-reductase
MRLIVTGAAGPLGRALIELLVRRGHRVVGQVRRLSGVALMHRLGAEPVVADVRRPEALVEAMKGCDGLFHLARYFDFWAPDSSTYDSVNVDGTKHAIGAAILAGVRRVVFCSSALTRVDRHGASGAFSRPTALEESQLAAERFADKSRAKGVEVVTVSPALVVAPADSGWTGRLIAECIAGRRRFASDNPVGWVWVEDAAAGLLHAFEKGKDGDRFVLCGDTLSPRQFLRRVARIAGRSAPAALPPSLGHLEAVIATALAAPFGRRPSISRDEARFAATGFQVNGEYDAHELGITYTPLFQYLPPVVKSYSLAQERFSA